jgi:hypothetical protein
VSPARRRSSRVSPSCSSTAPRPGLPRAVRLARAHLLHGECCEARAGGSTPASSCGPHTRCSCRWARSPSRAVSRASCSPPASAPRTEGRDSAGRCGVCRRRSGGARLTLPQPSGRGELAGHRCERHHHLITVQTRSSAHRAIPHRFPPPPRRRVRRA